MENAPSPSSLYVESRNGLYVARRINDDLSWGIGAIRPQSEFDNEADRLALLGTVLDSLEEVDQAEMPYSCCTDGRCPNHLESGEPVPVREQTVGADIMTMFHMAEALGDEFYKDPRAPLDKRVMAVAEFMRDNGLMPSTHAGCGAAGGYPVINRNLVGFSANTGFMERQKLLLPGDTPYDDTVREQLTSGYEARAKQDAYNGWNDKLITDAVMRVSGPRAIAHLRNDGRGQGGHVEELIMRNLLPGIAINEAKVFGTTGGREVFGVNDDRVVRLAKLIGHRSRDAFTVALMAGEDFTDGAHGTLAHNLPTYVIEAKAA